jgi:hypothetical protein
VQAGTEQAPKQALRAGAEQALRAGTEQAPSRHGSRTEQALSRHWAGTAADVTGNQVPVGEGRGERGSTGGREGCGQGQALMVLSAVTPWGCCGRRGLLTTGSRGRASDGRILGKGSLHGAPAIVAVNAGHRRLVLTTAPLLPGAAVNAVPDLGCCLRAAGWERIIKKLWPVGRGFPISHLYRVASESPTRPRPITARLARMLF